MPRAAALPKYEKVREKLRARILDGQYAPGMRLPTEIELFREFRASDSTVVRALNDLAREGLIVRRRGSGTFVAEQANPPLLPGRRLKLGILWYHSVRASLFGGLCHELSRGALDAWGLGSLEPEFEENRAGTYTRAAWRQQARNLVVECLGNEWGGQSRAPALKVVRDAGYDGLMTLGIIEEAWLGELLNLGLPAVIVDCPSQRLGRRADLVYADPQIGYRDAVDAFVARGLTRIHFVTAYVWDPHKKINDPSRKSGFRYGKRTDPDSFLRLSTFRQAMDAHRLEVQDAHIHRFDGAAAPELAARLAALPELERPQALVCHGLDHANALVAACAAQGLHLEAAGATDRRVAGPAVNILLNTREMGSVAGELLLRRLKQPDRPYLNVGIQMDCLPSPAAVNG
ncbi:MAG: GntR family transcriptional regulator [Planctomycetota bacterium]|nr:GntR family transcriptional regulator [Planctomycetota bacterium]